MQVINVRNVHDALPEAVYQLLQRGRTEPTRTGNLLRFPTPVTTCYTNPRERVIFWPQRDANPFFHFYEALWMLNGQNDVASLTRFVARMHEYSDDGVTFHGAYGKRWRKHFTFNPGVDSPVDQLSVIAKALRDNPNCRRQVLQMWDCPHDLLNQSNKRDVPCNLDACFNINCDALDMTVFNRSNDIVWGCYGANAVHFSMLQEVMAAWIGVPVGMYWQVSNNWHAYQDSLNKVRELADRAKQPLCETPWNPYTEGYVTPFSMVNVDIDTWLADLRMFMDLEDKATGYRDIFFRGVAVPMMQAHDMYRQSNKPQSYLNAIAQCAEIKATDWRVACTQWLERRHENWKRGKHR